MSLKRLLDKQQGKNTQPKAKQEVSAADASAQGLGFALDRYLGERNAPVFRKIDGFHPSYTNECPRWWVLLFRGAPSERTFEPRVHRILDMGHTVHERWYQYLEAMGILVDTEIPIKISYPVPVKGNADGIIDWGGHKLIEMKSISSNGFAYRKIYRKAKDDHYRQAQLYLRALKLEEGYVIYENKDTQEYLIIPIVRDDDFIDKQLERWEEIYKIFEADEIPARPYKQDSKNCKACDLRNFCWGELDD